MATRDRRPATERVWRKIKLAPKHQERRRLAKYLPWSRMTEQQRQQAMLVVRFGEKRGG